MIFNEKFILDQKNVLLYSIMYEIYYVTFLVVALRHFVCLFCVDADCVDAYENALCNIYMYNYNVMTNYTNRFD